MADPRLLSEAELERIATRAIQCWPSSSIQMQFVAASHDVSLLLSHLEALGAERKAKDALLKKIAKLRGFKTASDVYEHMPWSELEGLK
jgi:hypothetical protein